jgi:hypothetical protein
MGSNQYRQDPLSPRHVRALDLLMEGTSKADAMRLAGFSECYATKHQVDFFDRPLMKAELARRQRSIRRKYELDEDWVIQRLMRVANSGEILARFKKVQDDGSLAWDFTGATEDELAAINELTVTTRRDSQGDEIIKVKVGAADPKGALDSLCRRLGLFEDRIRLEGELSLVERISRGRDRARGKDGSDKNAN